MQLQVNILRNFLENSLKEDYGICGDITSNSIIDANQKIDFQINSRENIVLCGTDMAKYYFDEHSSIIYNIEKSDSNIVEKNQTIISGSGLARDVLILERIILNYLQHLSGIATYTNQFVQKVKNTNAKIYDTRKTLPLYRHLQKYAVKCGGGHNHRLALDSSILIKDNHIAICGSVKEAMERAKNNAPHYTRIEIECDTLKQVEDSIKYGADIIMLDNMSQSQLQEAVRIIDGRAKIEASGNVSLDNVSNIANTGVDMISVGKITHSARSVDIGLDI